MEDAKDRCHRWDPVDGLQEDIVGSVWFQYDGEALTLTAKRDKGPDVRLRFNEVEAFKAYEEFSDVSETTFEVAQIVNASWNYPWPFQEVDRSFWVSRVKKRNGAIEDKQLRHCIIRSFDMAVHVMFAGEPEVELLP